MNDSLTVLLNDATVGTLARSRGGRLSFTYDASYQARREVTPLSVSMPAQIRSHPDRVISPWLWNLLPENEAVLLRWARQFHASASSPFSLLATPIGQDCAGAVRFEEQGNVAEARATPGDVTWLTEAGVAGRLRELKADSTAWLGRSFTGQFSLAGAQAKTALLCQDGRWGVPHGAKATTHILKPAVAGLDDHDLNEHLCLDAARRAGLIAVRTRVARFGAETAIVVDRYDRRVSNGITLRIHQEDLCQAMGLPPTRKYQAEGGPAPAQIAELFRKIMSPRNADDAIERFFDALVWNWLIGGTDAHAKNYSLLLAGGEVRLAPLYDIASSLPYGAHERKLRLAMKIGGSYDVVPWRNTWSRAAAELRIDRQKALVRVRELTRIVVEAFRKAAAEPDVVALHRELPSRLINIIDDRASRCARVIDADPVPPRESGS
jgi:serine/threonine-protein kinase HipA